MEVIQMKALVYDMIIEKEKHEAAIQQLQKEIMSLSNQIQQAQNEQTSNVEK